MYISATALGASWCAWVQVSYFICYFICYYVITYVICYYNVICYNILGPPKKTSPPIAPILNTPPRGPFWVDFGTTFGFDFLLRL